MSPIGDKIKNTRAEMGITQEILSENSGISQPALSRIERGDVPSPSWQTVVRIERALGLAPGELTAGLDVTVPVDAKHNR